MMARLRQKAPAARLTQADASRLPYPGAHFDALLTVHVMHLVGPWREALREYRRVLKPGGVYLNAHTESDDETPRARIRDHFRERLSALGYEDNRPGVRDDADLYAEIATLGAMLRHVDAVRYEGQPDTPRHAIDDLASRTNSNTWDIPDDIFAAALAETQAWAAAEYPGLDRPFVHQSRFVVDVVKF
jgi:SAM-dependent methyltransferase